ncbi:M24 family metallopeptidase [Halostagnicola sp. A-GB9-2]|uniref:M24 family metallopeptidase n=1 Tax=Halostagnicola sp. A-GB9-2 TaxID=3048066 RepID=UPI0024C073B1|nr:M24 family metallopeptidase [Halostagnicola sp. A-GB9-2]MDJ1432412.1 peptidase M24 [Halostagnicola sp. A-GB9-2]
MIGAEPPTALLESDLSSRDAGAFVHVGSARVPAIRYCLTESDSESRPRGLDAVETIHAIGFDGSSWHHSQGRKIGNGQSGTHPADDLATRLADEGVSGTVLTPATIPHDAALFLEQAGFELASSDVLSRARRSKSNDERVRIERAQKAGADGTRRAATVLAETDVDDEALVFDGKPLTNDRLRTAVDGAIVAAGALSDGLTRITSTTDGAALRAGEPIVIELSPRGLEGYHGGLTRTFVVESDGGGHRRAHVALTRAFRSVRSKLTDATHSVTAVEADLEAEIRAFGFGDADDIETRVTGVGLEPREAPTAADADVGPETVVRIEAAVRVDDERSVRLADLLVPGEPARWLESPSRSLDPAAYDRFSVA